MKPFTITSLIAVLLFAPALAFVPTGAMAQTCSEGLATASQGTGHIDLSTVAAAPDATVHVLPSCASADVAAQLTSSGETAITEAIAKNPKLLAILHSQGFTQADVLGGAMVNGKLELFVAKK